MKRIHAISSIFGATLGAGGLSAYKFFNTSNSTDPGLAEDKFIEVTFFNNDSNSIKMAAKVRIPINNIENTLAYKYCEVSSSTGSATSSSSSSSSSTVDTCTTFTDVTNTNKKAKTLSELALSYLTVQHFTNSMKAILSLENNSAPSSGASTKCVCNCTNCAAGSCCKTGCTNACCTTDPNCNCCCAENITALTDEKIFNASISNLSSSYSNHYFSPTNVYICLGDLKLADINNSADGSKDSSSTTEQTKTLYGSILYSYVDYYYKTATNQLDNWIQQQYQNPTVNSSSTKTTEEKYYINYPFKFTYKIKLNNSSATTTTTTPTNCTTGYDLGEAFKSWSNKSKAIKDIKADANNTSELKKIINCTRIGEIEKSKISEISKIFNNTCCKKP